MGNRSELNLWLIVTKPRLALAGLFLLAVSFAFAQDPNQNSNPAQVPGTAEGQPADPLAPNPQPTTGANQGQGQGAPGTHGSVLSAFMEPFEYDPQGRKDPFSQPMIEKPLPAGAMHGPVLPLQKYKLEQLALTGIIWDVARPRAMVKDPSGKIHVVGPNAKLGDRNGYVAVIREGELVVIETFEEDGKLFSSARVVKMSGGDNAAAPQ